jgi:hypothetical protein
VWAMLHSGVRGGGGAAVVAGGDGEVLLPEGEKMGEERPKKEGEGWGGGSGARSSPGGGGSGLGSSVLAMLRSVGSDNRQKAGFGHHMSSSAGKTLLQKRFVVSAVKSFFVSISPADTILRIQKIDYFLYRLFPADTQNRFSKIKKSEPRSGHVGPRSGPARRRPSR